MYAIVTAGGIPRPGEPLYELTQGQSKSLLDIAGKPMIQWVLDAISGATQVDGVIVMGLEASSGITCDRPLYFHPNQNSMLENILAGIAEIKKIHPGPQHILIVSSDIPAITAEMVDWVATTVAKTDDDIYYNVVPQEVMEKRYPNSKRTYTHLKDMVVCGGDLNAVHTRAVDSDMSIWHALIEARKNPLKQASMFGLDVLFLLLIRQIRLQEAVERVARRVHLKGRALVSPYAEIGMDVDKPHQLEMMRTDLARFARKS